MSDNLTPANLLLIFKKEGFDDYSLANEAGLPIKNPAGLVQAGANRPFVDIKLLTTLTKEMKANKNLGGYSFLSSFHSPNPEHVFVLLEKNEPTPEDDFETVHRPLPEIPSKTAKIIGTGAGTIKSAANGWVTTGSHGSNPSYESDSAVSASPKNGYYHRIWKAVDQVHSSKRGTKHQGTSKESAPSSSSITIGPFTQSVCDEDEYIGWTAPSTADSATATVSSCTVKNNESTASADWHPVDTFDINGTATTFQDDESYTDTEPVDDSFYERYYEKRTVPLADDEQKKKSKYKKEERHARGVHRCCRGSGRPVQFRLPRVAEQMMIPAADELGEENAKRRKLYEGWGIWDPVQDKIREQQKEDDYRRDAWCRDAW